MKLKEKFNYENILDHLNENDTLYYLLCSDRIWINKLPKNYYENQNHYLKLTKNDLFNELGIYRNRNGKKVFQDLTMFNIPYVDNLYLDLDSMELME